MRSCVANGLPRETPAEREAPLSFRGSVLYHASRLSLNKRLTRGFTAPAYFARSRLVDNLSSDGDKPTGPFNFRHERGPLDLDLTHRCCASYVGEMPRLAILTLESEVRINFVSGRDIAASGVNNDRAGLVGDPFLTASRSRGEVVAAYFERAAFAQNAPGTFGAAGRNIVRGAGSCQCRFRAGQELSHPGTNVRAIPRRAH